MNDNSEDWTISADPDVVSCPLGTGAALLDLRSGTYFSLNAVGAFVWERLRQPARFDGLCSAVLSEFDVDAERCRADLSALIGQFQSAGLVIEHEAAG